MKNLNAVSSKKAVKKSVEFNKKPQFGFDEKQWSKLMSVGKKLGKSLVPMLREAALKQYRLG